MIRRNLIERNLEAPLCPLQILQKRQLIRIIAISNVAHPQFLCIIVNHFELLWSIVNHFELPWIAVDRCESLWITVDRCGSL